MNKMNLTWIFDKAKFRYIPFQHNSSMSVCVHPLLPSTTWSIRKCLMAFLSRSLHGEDRNGPNSETTVSGIY